MCFVRRCARFLWCLLPSTRCARHVMPPLPAPTVSRSTSESGQSTVVITADCLDTSPHCVVRYTLDGSVPRGRRADGFALASGVYLAPLLLPVAWSGKVTARAWRALDSRDGDGSDPAELLLVAEGGVLPQPHPSTIPMTQDRDYGSYNWAVRHEAFLKLGAGVELVFLVWGGEPHDRHQPGQSVWDRFYSGRKPLNLGYGFDRTENMLWRISHGELDACQDSAKLVVVLAGTNNIPPDRSNTTAFDIVSGVRAILREVVARTARTHVVLVSLLPREDEKPPLRPGLDFNPVVVKTNALLATLEGSHGGRVSYLDIGRLFLKPITNGGGFVDGVMLGDLIHPSESGYRIMADALEPTVSRWLGPI